MLYRVVAKLFGFATGPSPDELAERVEWCLRTDDPHAVDDVISLHYDALEYYSATHDQRGLLRQGNSQDLDNAIAFYREALALQPVGCPDRSTSLNNLGSGLSTRFKRRGNVQDLDEAITLHTEALSLRSVGHSDRCSSLNNLANDLSARFEHRGNDQDLDEAIVLFREALSFCPVGDPDRFKSLHNLGILLCIRFKHRGKNQDLDEAVTLYRKILSLCPVGHPARYTSLNTLANQLSTRFEHRGNDQDLGEAIMLHREALSLSSVGHPDRPMSLNNLGNDLFIRFERRGNVQDLDEAIMLHREALSLRSICHPDRSTSLNNLGNDSSPASSSGAMEALASRPVGHPERSMSLKSLGVGLFIRFASRGNHKDLDDAIALCREALASCPVGHPDRPVSLNNLGFGLSTRFANRGSDQDLDEAFTIHTEALALRPAGHPDRHMSLTNLGNALANRFEHRGNDQDLDKAIAFQREALAAKAVGCPDRSTSLYNLGSGLATRFDHRGNDKDLDEAITLCREALSLHPVGHPDMSMSLNNLAAVLSTRFGYRGSDQDLDEAIALHREALSFRPVGHPDRFMSLNNLGGQLSTRFDHRGNDQDLDEAIALYREALASCSVNHPHRSSSLSNLGNGFSVRFEHRGNGQDLEEAIALHREALSLCSVGHPDRSSSLMNNLGNRLSIRFKDQGNEQDLDEATALHRKALSLRSVGHPDLFMSLNNLGNVLLIRFEHQHNGEDLSHALENLRCALALLKQHDPRQSVAHQSLATAYLLSHQSRLDGTGEDTDNINAVMHHIKVAANTVSGGLLSRLRASLRWVRHAEEYTHCTLLEAFATSMSLLDAYISATASVSSRHDAMKLFPGTLAVDAASCALRSGDVCRAVELLEQGRTLIWTQIARFRMPIDSLPGRGDHQKALMKKFRDLSSLLDRPPVNHSDGDRKVDAEAEATRYTRLVKDWNEAVEAIRKLEGFSNFLLTPLFSELQDAARGGPVIVLIASKSYCHAIIVPHKEPPINVGLAIDVEKITRLANAFQRTVNKQANHLEKQAKLIEALRELWVEVVHPVVSNLGKFAKPGSRIWWCPTSFFSFMPLHAAGEYRRGGKSLAQLYISSYTPSLTALIKARRHRDQPPPVSFAAIGQNRPEGASFTLDCVEPELTLNYMEPFKSAFLMRDKPLSLLDIAQLDLSSHAFAFLSACETAVGDFHTPDEVIHLAAALQFAGVNSVIGTLWKVNDPTVQHLVEAFYKTFCGDGTMNSKRAARALHRAVQSLADGKDMPLDQRILRTQPVATELQADIADSSLMDWYIISTSIHGSQSVCEEHKVTAQKEGLNEVRIRIIGSDTSIN
ncbi:TPR-like protein [Suillus placidus]|uniref:TPR-like protein n=1 Tax=Suillus placidus TaxID=48579 RepID=A0A9P7A2E2_9AGAM|nr:TPR-like protein [Suillus placidus]